MDKELTLGSLFDGVGGWQLAAVHNGIRPIWSSEIEAFPMAVTKKHFPNTLQLGDITKLDGAKIPPVDIICAGSPCQDLSIAGKREGLKGERSGLFRKAIDIVRGMRAATDGRKPRFFVWENVPGAFSSNNGHDFQAVLEEISEESIPMPGFNKWAKSGMVRSRKCDITWRVLDAKYWGVPQRRNRIFLIADFGRERRPEILFESKGLYRHPAESSNERESSSNDVKESLGDAIPRTLQVRCGNPIGGGKGALIQDNMSATLSCQNNQTLFQPIGVDTYNLCTTDGVACTLTASMHKGVGHGPGVMMQEGFTRQSNSEFTDNDPASSCKARDYKDFTDVIVETDIGLVGGRVKTALGNKTIGSLCAADGTKGVTGQSLGEGKLIIERLDTDEAANTV